jgi:hypothetical protein
LSDALLSELDFVDSAGLAFADSAETEADLSLEPLAAPSFEVESPEDSLDSLLSFERA